MSFNAAALKLMADKGLSAHDIAEIAGANEQPSDTAAERRRAWDRERKREQREAERLSGGMSGGNPPDKGSNDKDILTSKEILPQEANASLPQGAKTQRTAVLWPCPDGVDKAHWRDFLANRKRKRCATTQTALAGVLGDIARIADDEWPPGRLVQHAAAKGWASINDPREAKHGERPDNRRSGWEAAYRANMGAGGHG